jgi:phage tail sheath gpL-like
MTITSQIPADRLQPRTWVELDFTSHSRGASPNERNALVIGMRTTGSGLAVSNVPYEVVTEADADDLFGEGSEAATMCRVVFAVWRSIEEQGLGGAGRLFAIGTIAPAGVAATGTVTFTGPATEGGTFDIIVAGVRCPVNITSGDSAATMAAAFKASVDQKRLFLPVTASIAGAVVTLTYNHLGLNGNLVTQKLDQAQRLMAGVGVAFSAATLASGTLNASLTNALDASLNRLYKGVAIAESDATTLGVMVTYVGTSWSPAKKNFGRVFTGSRGSIAAGTTLAAASNHVETTILGCTGIPAHPMHLAAAGAAIRTANDRPSFNWDGLVLPFLAPDVVDAYDQESEFQSVLYGGVSALGPDGTGLVKLSRLITTKTTEGGIRFDETIDTIIPDTLAELGLRIDAQIAALIQHESMDDQLIADAKSTAYDECKAAEKERWISGVDDLAPSLLAERHPTNRNRIVTQVPAFPLPAAHQAVTKMVLWTEATRSGT